MAASLIIPESRFVKSCPHVGLAPRPPLPEIAFAGRSNVGKSSLINSLLNRRKLAHTSKTPGKTQYLNYYEIGKQLCYFVDLPGYGYAQIPESQKRSWSRHLEGYFRDSAQLRLAVLILDLRRGLTDMDQQMIEALHIYKRPWIIVITKTDKLTASASVEHVKHLSGQLISLGAGAVLPYSSLRHSGREAVWEQITAAVQTKK